MKKRFLSFLAILVILVNMFAVFTSAAGESTHTVSFNLNRGVTESGNTEASGGMYTFKRLKPKFNGINYYIMPTWTNAAGESYVAMFTKDGTATDADGNYINRYTGYLIRSCAEVPEGNRGIEEISTITAATVPFDEVYIAGLSIESVRSLNQDYLNGTKTPKNKQDTTAASVELVEEDIDSIPAGSLKITLDLGSAYSNSSSSWHEITLVHTNGDSYTLAFNVEKVTSESVTVSNGGSLTMTVADNDTIDLPEVTKDLCTFVGWYTDAEFTEAWDENTAITGDVTLHAKWDAPEHTVTFVDGGTTVDTKTEEYDTTIDELPIPTKDDVTFVGWYTDEALTIPWNETDLVPGDMTLYAAWEYTVAFKNADGSTISSQVYRYGDEVILPEETPKKADDTHTYTFAGWDKEVTACTGNATYTATYTAEILGSTVAAIVGIAAAALVVLGLVGFFIFRFVGRKKK